MCSHYRCAYAGVDGGVSWIWCLSVFWAAGHLPKWSGCADGGTHRFDHRRIVWHSPERGAALPDPWWLGFWFFQTAAKGTCRCLLYHCPCLRLYGMQLYAYDHLTGSKSSFRAQQISFSADVHPGKRHILPIVLLNVSEWQKRKKMLREGKDLADITYQLGFSSQSHFTNFFQKVRQSHPETVQQII